MIRISKLFLVSSAAIALSGAVLPTSARRSVDVRWRNARRPCAEPAVIPDGAGDDDRWFQLACGQSVANGERATATGVGAVANADNSTALRPSSASNDDSATAIGHVGTAAAHARPPSAQIPRLLASRAALLAWAPRLAV